MTRPWPPAVAPELNGSWSHIVLLDLVGGLVHQVQSGSCREFSRQVSALGEQPDRLSGVAMVRLA